MTLRSNLIALAMSSIFAASANAYTCEEMASDITKGATSKEDLGGFSSVDHKLTAIKDIFLRSFPEVVAESSYNDYKSKNIQNAYQASLSTYRSMMQASFATKELLDDLIPKEGGISQFVTNQCKNPKSEVRSIFQAIFLVVQKDLAN